MTSVATTPVVIDDHTSWGRYKPGLLARLLLTLTRKTPLGRGRARGQLHAFLKAGHDGPLDCDLFGQPIRAYLEGNRCEWKTILNPALFDPHERRLIANALDRPNAVMLDIGANVGFHAIAAAKFARPDARIVVFEPHPETFRRLAYNLGLNSFPGFTALEVALGENDCVAAMSGTDLSLSTLAIAGEGPPVRVRPLLDCLSELGIEHIDILKIDVEGYEGQVLQPFLAHAPQALIPDLVIIEHFPDYTWDFDCIAGLVARGMKVTGRAGNNAILTKAGA